MADDQRRVAMLAKIRALRASGKSAQEIMAMRDEVLSAGTPPPGISRDPDAPTPTNKVRNATGRFPVTPHDDALTPRQPADDGGIRGRIGNWLVRGLVGDEQADKTTASMRRTMQERPEFARVHQFVNKEAPALAGASAVGGGAGSLLGRVLGGQIVSQGVAGVAGRIGAQSLAGGGAGALAGATEAALSGEDIVEGTKRGGLTGSLIGGTAQAVLGEPGRAIANRLASPRTQSGQAIGALDEMQSRGVTRGAVERADEAAGIMKGKAGSGQVAYDLQEQFRALNDKTAKAARAGYGTALRQIAAENPRPVDLSRVHSALDGEVRVASNGEVIDPQVAAAVADVKRLITAKPGPTLFGPRGERMGGGGAARGTLADLRDAKEYVVDRAQFGAPASPDNVPYRKIYATLSGATKQMDPRLAALDEQFSGTMSKLERANDLVYGKETPDVVGRAGAQVRGANTIGRQFEDTKPAGVRARQMQELAELDPEYAKLIRLMDERQALEATSFGAPGIHMGVEMAGLPGLVKQNANAIRARAVYPAARGLEQDAAAASVALTPFHLEADRARRRRER